MSTTPKPPAPIRLDSPNFRVVLSNYAAAKIRYACQNFPTEVGGFGILDYDGENPLRIIDFIVTKQTCTSTTVDYDNEGIAKFYDDMMQKNLPQIAYASCQIHTHPASCTRPSGTDEADSYSKYEFPINIFVICIKNGDWYARVKTVIRPFPGSTQPIIFEREVPVLIEDANYDRATEWDKEIKENVTTRTHTHSIAPYQGNYRGKFDYDTMSDDEWKDGRWQKQGHNHYRYVGQGSGIPSGEPQLFNPDLPGPPKATQTARIVGSGYRTKSGEITRVVRLNPGVVPALFEAQALLTRQGISVWQRVAFHELELKPKQRRHLTALGIKLDPVTTPHSNGVLVKNPNIGDELAPSQVETIASGGYVLDCDGTPVDATNIDFYRVDPSTKQLVPNTLAK